MTSAQREDRILVAMLVSMLLLGIGYIMAITVVPYVPGILEAFK